MSKIPPHVQAFIDSIKDVNFYSCSGPIDPSWKLSTGNTWDAARAVYSTAYGAAYRTAYVAAYNAAYKDAYGAARGAACCAAYNAVFDAAYNAVHDATHDAALLAVCLLMQDKIDKKYLEHAQARWEVWKRGYRCYCDVDGVLYVYAKLNGLEKARRRI